MRGEREWLLAIRQDRHALCLAKSFAPEGISELYRSDGERERKGYGYGYEGLTVY